MRLWTPPLCLALIALAQSTASADATTSDPNDAPATDTTGSADATSTAAPATMTVVASPAPAPPTETRRRRGPLRTVHFWAGVTTWISLVATTTIGTMRYANVVGFGEANCAPEGSPILGRSYGCGTGLRTQHLVSASFTTASYITTRTLAALMPDPGYEPSTRLRVHRALSWVHLVGMVAMPVLGFATSGSSDPGTRDALGTAHLLVGYSTLAAVTAAGALMVF
ncbi:MAG: hypothetical protein KC657_32995 [Myxococcales bacterium]|nr:hypothetical protein [Myxococcales bacterium]